MVHRHVLLAILGVTLIGCGWSAVSLRAAQSPKPAIDPAQQAVETRAIGTARPEQKRTNHDEGMKSAQEKPAPITTALNNQPHRGAMTGFDFARDPLNASKPHLTFAEVMAKESEQRAAVMAAQKQLLQSRYDLTPRFDEQTRMSRGKPVPRGPTARLKNGGAWEQFDQLTATEIRERALFPYPSLPHPLHVNGGQVFPTFQIDMFPRLQRFDVDFDLPDAFVPEFPPAVFLQSRPELGDVSRGQVLHLGNFREILQNVMTPAQLEGMRLLLTPIPQEEFNLTDDRKSPHPQLGVACFDCHVNGHTTAQFHLSPDIRPQERRFRLDTTSLRGMFNQRIHGSKRSLRSIEDFTEFEQRIAYFNGDSIRAMKKGFQEIPRSQIPHMAQAQNMFDLPPAPKLNVFGRLDPGKSTEQERRGETLFFGKAQCAQCHPAPFYLDDKMHDLQLQRFVDEPGDGPIKTFTLRGLKDSPPYLHDGRCLTIEDTVEFFNIILQLRLSPLEKADLAAFLKTL